MCDVNNILHKLIYKSIYVAYSVELFLIVCETS